MSRIQKGGFNPLKLLVGWTILMVVLTIFIVLASSGNTGGEQNLFTTIVIMLLITIIGATIISILIIAKFRDWTKANRSFYILASIILVPIILLLLQIFFQSPYSLVEETEEINGNIVEKRTEYYDNHRLSIRSISFWKNGKKDSTWVVYDRQGKIMTANVYKNEPPNN